MNISVDDPVVRGRPVNGELTITGTQLDISEVKIILKGIIHAVDEKVDDNSHCCSCPLSTCHNRHRDNCAPINSAPINSAKSNCQRKRIHYDTDFDDFLNKEKQSEGDCRTQPNQAEIVSRNKLKNPNFQTSLGSSSECRCQSQSRSPKANRFQTNFLEVEKIIDNTERQIGRLTLPFSLDPGNQVFPSGSISGMYSRVSVRYVLEARVKYSMGYYLSFLKSFKTAWTKSTDLIAYQPKFNPIEEQILELRKQVKVGMWYDESNQWTERLKYAFGKDTAAHWFKLDLEARMASSINVSNEPFYVQTKLQLFASPAEKLPMALYPEMEVTYLKIDLFSKAVVTCNDPIAAETTTNMGTLSNVSFKFNSDQPCELSALLSGLKFPTEKLLSTVSSTILAVSHELRVKLKVRCLSVDGTKQRDESVSFNFPVEIYLTN